MRTTPAPAERLVGATTAALIGAGFFFAIIDVFGPPASIVALALMTFMLRAVPGLIVLRREPQCP